MDERWTQPELARFRILSRLGGGSQGAVYEALDLERNVHVALKTLRFSRSDQSDQIVRFKNEFRAIRDLRHPNLVHLGELSEENGLWFFTMEIVHGTDFLDWVRGPSATPQDTSSAPTAAERATVTDTLRSRAPSTWRPGCRSPPSAGGSAASWPAAKAGRFAETATRG